MFELEEAKR